MAPFVGPRRALLVGDAGDGGAAANDGNIEMDGNDLIGIVASGGSKLEMSSRDIVGVVTGIGAGKNATVSGSDWIGAEA